MTNASMEVHRYSDPQAFYDATRDVLLENEAANNLIFGIVNTMIERPEVYAGDNYMAAVTEGDELVGVAYRTPPHNLVLSYDMPKAAVELVAADYAMRGDELPGALGPTGSVEPFLAAWTALRGVDVQVEQEQRIYKLTEVIPVEGVAGCMRMATADDEELVTEWGAAFEVEAIGTRDATEEVRERSHKRAQRLIEDERLALWELAGQPVSMAACAGPTPHGIRVNYVYTPPETRNHGYASAVTAALSQKLLDEGRTYCFLYTDLANPTSNHIYQEIGYRPVCDNNVYRFTARSAGS